MKLLKNKYVKIVILLLALAAFAYYYANNSSKFEVIADIQWWQLLLIIIGQTTVIVSNVLILVIFGLFLNKKIPILDSARITAYSSLVNFFGFLQGGLGLRGVYLKYKVGMSFKNYFSLTALQYLLLFSLSGILIGAGLILYSGPSLIVTAWVFSLLLAITVTAFVFIKMPPKYTDKAKQLLSRIRDLIQYNLVLFLLAAIVLQLAGSFLVGFTELQAIGADITINSLLIYTGVSQFSILIAVTPGAIGIREGLLLIVQEQMHLTVDDIVLAATLDRVVYFITLAIISPLAIGVGKFRKPS